MVFVDTIYTKHIHLCHVNECKRILVINHQGQGHRKWRADNVALEQIITSLLDLTQANWIFLWIIIKVLLV